MATDSKPSAEHVNLWHKVVAGVFGTVLAPVLVTVGIKWSDKLTAPADEKPAAVAAAAPPIAPATGATAAAPAATAPAGVATAPTTTAPAPTVTAPVANVSVSAPPTATANVLPASSRRRRNGRRGIDRQRQFASIQETALAGTAAVQRPRPDRLLHLRWQTESQGEAPGEEPRSRQNLLRPRWDDPHLGRASGLAGDRKVVLRLLVDGGLQMGRKDLAPRRKRDPASAPSWWPSMGPTACCAMPFPPRSTFN